MAPDNLSYRRSSSQPKNEARHPPQQDIHIYIALIIANKYRDCVILDVGISVDGRMKDSKEDDRG